jgi:hypothetical protein
LRQAILVRIVSGDVEEIPKHVRAACGFLEVSKQCIIINEMVREEEIANHQEMGGIWRL